jgi:hypothetical protein
MWDMNIAPSEIDRYPAIRMENKYICGIGWILMQCFWMGG